MTHRWKRRLMRALVVVIALAAPAYVWRAELALNIAQRVADSHMRQDAIAELPDGLHVGLCGAGSPFPDELRGGPCTLVLAGRQMLVFDAGNQATRNITRMRFAMGRIDAAFLTHFHSDHIDGLGELLLQRWIQGGHDRPLPVFGPSGVSHVVNGLREAYGLDQTYRTAHHGETVAPPSGFGASAQPFELADSTIHTVYDHDGVTVEAFAVHHAPVHPAVGYRIRYKGRSVVISGDTTPLPIVVTAAKGADLLLHEALSPRLVSMLGQAAGNAHQNRLARIMKDIVDYHTTVEQAAEVAQAAGVHALVLHHIVPMLPDLPGLATAFLGRAPELYTGSLTIGRDGDFFSLPAGSRTITHSQRF